MDLQKKKNYLEAVWQEIRFDILIQHKTVFFSTLLWGLAAHGYMFFNKFSWHDDLFYLEGVGATYTSGRWFLGVLGELVNITMGHNVSVPWFNGLAALLLVALGNVLLVEIFHLKKRISAFFVGGVMIVFPSLVTTYGYMFTVAYMMFSAFLAILGVYLAGALKKAYLGIPAGAICICLSLGIYQGYLPLAATVCLMAFLNNVIMEPESVLKRGGGFEKAVRWVLSLSFGLVSYFIVNNTILAVKGLVLTNYMGISNMGHTNLETLLGGIISAFKEFFVPVLGGRADLYMLASRKAYYVALVITVCLLVWHILQVWKKNRAASLLLFAAALCFPIAMNLQYLMGAAGVHGVMLYARVMIFVLPVVLNERLESCGNVLRKCSAGLVGGVLLYSCLFYTHYANMCYLQAEFQHSKEVSLMTTLATQIKSTKGYRKDLPIVYLNAQDIYSDSLKDSTDEELVKEFGIELEPYFRTFWVWKKGMRNWCGFYQEEITDEKQVSKIEAKKEVQDMPSYPTEGSIRIVDGVIVVKFDKPGQ